MENNLIKIDPKEYGLDENKVSTIEQAFMPMITEREGLSVIYGQLLTCDITPETSKKAGELRRKLVKVRTGISDIHKTQKQFFLAAGRFVDAWKNKETEPVEQMEQRLAEIETHFEKLEALRIKNLELERVAIVIQFTDFPASGLGLMANEVFDAYLTGIKVAYNAKIEAEKQAENERLRIESENKLHHERKEEILNLWNFLDDETKTLHFGQFSVPEWQIIVDALKSKKESYDLEQTKIKAENERLAKERADLEAKAKAKELESENERKKIEAERAKERAEADRKQRELQQQLKAKEDKERSDKLEADRIAKEKIAAEKKAQSAPDKDKLIIYIDSLKLPEIKLQTMEAATIEADIRTKFESFKTWALAQVAKM